MIYFKNESVNQNWETKFSMDINCKKYTRNPTATSVVVCLTPQKIPIRDDFVNTVFNLFFNPFLDFLLKNCVPTAAI